MKELTKEEKAKAYDEAIKIIKGNLDALNEITETGAEVVNIQSIKNYFYRAFPQLKESEDEKIRKAIIGFLKEEEAKADITSKRSETLCKYIAWLEKQGEQKDSYTKQQLRDMGFAFTLNGNIVTPEKTNEAIKELLAYQKKKWEEEQKPPNVEPKFKIGDWVVPNNGEPRVFMVEERGWPDSIISDPLGNQSVNTFTLDKQYHLWTIQDAKDGDVLCTYECDKPKIVFILKGTPKKHYALSYHCYYNIMYPHFDSDSEIGCLAPNDEDIKPATKEQCDLLFQKMKEAGYIWDADKKKLMKDEIMIKAGRNYRCTKTHIYAGLDWLEGTKYYADEDYSLVNNGCTCFCPKYSKYEHNNLFEEVECDGCIEKQCEHNPAWSEEDEKYFNILISNNPSAEGMFDYHQTNKSDFNKWLKSFKERVQPQPKPEWSEKDKQMYEGLLYNWRKSFKDRVQPQQKPEWSDEDEKFINNIEESLLAYKIIVMDNDMELANYIEKEINWLNSFKDRVMHS